MYTAILHGIFKLLTLSLIDMNEKKIFPGISA